jgi:predicted DNA-binding transcriptional regulator YafY
MNRTDRLMELLLLLQAKVGQPARDLAQQLGITERTLYRDLAALNEIGVPILHEPGAGYRIMDGFFLPPLVFSRDEAAALLLGGRMLALQAETRINADIERAMLKIKATLSEATLRHVDELTTLIQFAIPQTRFQLDHPHLRLLQHAINEQCLVHIRYHSFSKDELTERLIEPAHFTYWLGNWFVTAYCHLRQATRDFRLNRIEALRITDQQFTPRAAAPSEEPVTEVVIRVDSAAVRWVEEAQHHGYVAREDQPDGSVIMRYCVHAPLQMKPWLLMWGAAVEVLHPPELRALMRAEAQKLLQRLT